MAIFIYLDLAVFYILNLLPINSIFAPTESRDHINKGKGANGRFKSKVTVTLVAGRDTGARPRGMNWRANLQSHFRGEKETDQE